jgi:hypothetical protein
MIALSFYIACFRLSSVRCRAKLLDRGVSMPGGSAQSAPIEKFAWVGAGRTRDLELRMILRQMEAEIAAMAESARLRLSVIPARRREVI